MCRSILSLCKIAHKMWRDHLISQRNRTTERIVGWGLVVTGPLGDRGDRRVGGWTKFEKQGGRQ